MMSGEIVSGHRLTYEEGEKYADQILAGYMNSTWRVGRKVGRTIYAQLDDEPSDHDPLIGTMDTPELATAAVEAHNMMLDDDEWVGKP